MFELNRIAISHFIPGRVRVRIDQLKSNEALAKNIRGYASGMDLIKKLKINTLTGSVLIEYDPNQKEEIKKLFKQAKQFNLIPDEIDIDQIHSLLDGKQEIRDFSEEIRFFFKELNNEVKYWTGQKVGLEEMIPIGLLGLGLRSLLVAETIALPAWHTFFWYSFSTFLIFNPSKQNGNVEEGKLKATSG